MINFIVGFLIGAFTAQKFNIPKIEDLGSQLLLYLKKLENENEKENDKGKKNK